MMESNRTTAAAAAAEAAEDDDDASGTSPIAAAGEAADQPAPSLGELLAPLQPYPPLLLLIMLLERRQQRLSARSKFKVQRKLMYVYTPRRPPIYLCLPIPAAEPRQHPLSVRFGSHLGHPAGNHQPLCSNRKHLVPRKTI